MGCLSVVTMSAVTREDKKALIYYKIVGGEQMNTGWVESSDSPRDYSLQ